MNPRPLSRSVQQRQIKKLRPRHYEIMTRLLQYQNLRTISREMGINESWASVVVNSPVFQEEPGRRLGQQEKAVIEKLTDKEERRLEQLARLMRGEGGDPRVLDEPSLLAGSTLPLLTRPKSGSIDLRYGFSMSSIV